MYIFRKPILAALLKDRIDCLIITGATVLQLTLVALGLPGWRSPILNLVGLPDPGGGLTRPSWPCWAAIGKHH